MRINERKMTMKAVWNAVESLFPWGICLLIGMALGKALRVFTG